MCGLSIELNVYSYGIFSYVQNSLLAMGTETSAMALLQYPDFVAILNVA